MQGPTYIKNAATGYMPALMIPDFKSKREEVRWKVRHLNLCALDRETRQAAAADPAIIWDATIRQYRFRRRSDLAAPAQPLDAAEGCASVVKADRTGDRRDTAPAPGDRSLNLIAEAPDLNQRAADNP